MFINLILALSFATLTFADKTPVVNVVLVGATGDLSKKYLLQALSRVDVLRFQGKQPELVVWPCARMNEEKGNPTMLNILDKSLQCKQGTDYILDDEIHECHSNHAEFKARVMPYSQVKYDDDYKSLDTKIDDHNLNTNYEEVGRLMYLSIPPKAYRNVSRSISTHARPQPYSAENAKASDDLIKPWLRVVFEKPFGSDSDSAHMLAEGISESLEEEEIYRIDHYLGKVGVQIIHAFRRANAAMYENLLTSEHVSSIDVVMKEKDDCAGRAGTFVVCLFVVVCCLLLFVCSLLFVVCLLLFLVSLRLVVAGGCSLSDFMLSFVFSFSFSFFFFFSPQQVTMTITV